MLIKYDTQTKEVTIIPTNDEESKVVNYFDEPYIAKILRIAADRISPPDVPYLVINEDRQHDITEEMTYQLLREGNEQTH